MTYMLFVLAQEVEPSIPATPMQYLYLFLVVLAMVLFSQLFNKKFGLKFSQQMEKQQRMKALQQELMEAQRNGDNQRMMELQKESMAMMQDMMKQQMLPSCLRMIIFMVIWFILGIIFKGIDFMGEGSGFFWMYFLYSLGLSLLITLFKKRFGKSSKIEKEEGFYDSELDHKLKSSININTESKIDKTIMLEASNYRNMLITKRKNGEIPVDIDIDEEVNRFIEERLESIEESAISVNNDNNSETSTKSWKQKISDASNEEE